MGVGGLHDTPVSFSSPRTRDPVTRRLVTSIYLRDEVITHASFRSWRLPRPEFQLRCWDSRPLPWCFVPL